MNPLLVRTPMLALTLCLLAKSSALAESPKAVIRGPERVAPDATIVLDARGSVADRPFRWKLEGPDVPFLTLDQDGRKGVVALVPSAPPGVYKFTLIARGVPTGEVEPDADAALHIVTVETPPPPVPPAPAPVPTPTPGPGPDPVTPPKPKPTTGTLHVSLVVDLNAMTPEIAVVREGLQAREAFKGLDARYRTYASDSPDLTRLRLAPVVAQAGGLPCVIVQDSGGSLVSLAKAPATEADLIALVSRLRKGE